MNVGNPILIEAVRKGDRDLTDLCVRRGANVNAQDRRGRTLLCQALFFGRRQLASLLVAAGADVNHRGRWGEPPLHVAVKMDEEDMCEMLLAHGADIHAIDEEGQTALSVSAEYGYLDIAELLIAHGARVDDQDRSEHTSLCYAAKHGHAGMVELLLRNDANVDPTPKLIRSPLSQAAGAGHEHIAQLLIAHGAKLTLVAAARLGHLDEFRRIVKASPEIHTVETAGRSALLAAIHLGDIATVKLLIDDGVDVNVGGDGSALRSAVHQGHIEITKFLIEAGADVNAQPGGWGRRVDPNPRTALRAAVESDNRAMVELLIAHGANPDSALSTAVARRNKELVELLVEAGATDSALRRAAGAADLDCLKLLLERNIEVIRMRDDLRRTLLQSAAFAGRRDIAEILIAMGAEIRLQEAALLGDVEQARKLIEKGANVSEWWQGRPVLTLAAMRGHEEVSRVLIENGAKPSLMDAVWLRELEMVRSLVEQGADVNQSEPTLGRTPLSIAAEGGYVDIAAFLIEKGADVTAEAVTGTVLEIAASRGHREMVELLIAKRARVNGRASDGRTALSSAAKSGQTVCAEVLLANGADPNVREYPFNTKRSVLRPTPLFVAVAEGHHALTALLIANGAEVDAKIDGGHTPLHTALERGHDEIAKLLVENNADLNTRNRQGETALDIAVRKGRESLAAILRERGARPGRR